MTERVFIMSDTNYCVKGNKCFTPLTDIISGMLPAHIEIIDKTKTLEELFNTLTDGVTMYTVRNNADTTIYPIIASSTDRDDNGAIVTLTKIQGDGMFGVGVFTFEYEGALYINHIYSGRDGIITSGWYQITTTAVNNGQ